MNIVKGYWKTHGKIPDYKEESRPLLSEPPVKGDYALVYQDNYVVRIDIDDFNKKTGAIVEPIRDKPRSEAVLSYLDNHGYKYLGIKTEHGVHIVMKKPESYPHNQNRGDWFCGIGVMIEAHVTKVFDPLRVNGIDRNIFKPIFDSEELDYLPACLFPLQKSKRRPFYMEFAEGDRNNHFSEYAFYLSRKGFKTEDIKEAIEALNTYVVDEPLEQSEIDTILRPETMEKLKDIEEQQKNGNISPETFKAFLDGIGMTINYNELLNIVEYGDIPDNYKDIVDVQNMMPIRLTADYSKFTGKMVRRSQVTDYIVLEADTHTFNPVKNFLNSCEWDKTDRFPELFKALGVKDKFYKTLIKKWFYQTSAMPFNTFQKSIQAEGVLILQGPEGIGKTRFFRQIAFDPLWFSSLNKDLNTKNKDILIQLISVWIGEIGEIDRTFKSNKSDIKSFITDTKDTIRKPYRAEQFVKPRTTSFCGTTNKSVFLNDDTGTRRWWIIPVKNKIDIENFAKEENLRQFWAQCFYTYQHDNKCFLLTEKERKELDSRNKQSIELIPSEEELRTRLDFDSNCSEWQWFSASNIKDMPEYGVLNYDVRQIGQALSAISLDDERIKKKRTKQGTKYFIPPAIRNINRARQRT